MIRPCFFQPAHLAHAVVVGLDRLRRAADRVGFDHVGVERALGQEVEIVQAAVKTHR